MPDLCPECREFPPTAFGRIRLLDSSLKMSGNVALFELLPDRRLVRQGRPFSGFFWRFFFFFLSFFSTLFLVLFYYFGRVAVSLCILNMVITGSKERSCNQHSSSSSSLSSSSSPSSPSSSEYLVCYRSSLADKCSDGIFQHCVAIWVEHNSLLLERSLKSNIGVDFLCSAL